MKMKVICAWCFKPLGQKECQEFNFPDVQFPVSHGICPECREKVLASIEKTFAKDTETEKGDQS